mgnify:CR=1 FL=1
MSRQTLYLDNGQLVRILPVFGTIREGFSQRVEMIYTNGKADPLWADVRPQASGAARDITVSAESRSANAIVLFDLMKKRPPMRLGIGFGGKLQQYQPTANEIREEILKTVVHELQHVVQGWVWGDKWAEMAGQAAAEAARKGGYLSNRYESAAENVAQSWVNSHRTEMKTGAFDFLFPPGTLA